MKRTVFLALLCLTLTLLLTGCASNADTQPSPSVGMTTPMTSPNVTNMPSATNNMDGVLGSDAQQITTADDALTASKELRDADRDRHRHRRGHWQHGAGGRYL